MHAHAEYYLHKSGDQLTLGTTTLLHESYIKLADREGLRFPDRGRFMAYASKALRRLVIDYVRARRAAKRGGEFQINRLGDQEPPIPDARHDEQSLERLGHALDQLSKIDPALAELVDLHFFGGFTFVEIAAFRECSERTVQRDWRKARMVLQRLVAEE